MDRHVRGMEARLGRTFSGRIHWAHRTALRGQAVRPQWPVRSGSLPGEDHPDAEGLTWLDRHEVAHCVMSAFAPLVSFEPPTVLIEGWAQANMGLAPIDLRDCANLVPGRARQHSFTPGTDRAGSGMRAITSLSTTRGASRWSSSSSKLTGRADFWNSTPRCRQALVCTADCQAASWGKALSTSSRRTSASAIGPVRRGETPGKAVAWHD